MKLDAMHTFAKLKPHMLTIQNHRMPWHIFQVEKPRVSLSKVTAKAVFVRL